MNHPAISITAADFYNQLNNNNDNTIDDACLITNEPLEPTHVTLNCNHKFNYLPLIYDIQASNKTRKKGAQSFHCPYCRTKQTQYIPYLDIVPFISGIHSEPNYLNYMLAKKQAKADAALAKKQAKADAVLAKKQAKADAKADAVLAKKQANAM